MGNKLKDITYSKKSHLHVQKETFVKNLNECDFLPQEIKIVREYRIKAWNVDLDVGNKLKDITYSLSIHLHALLIKERLSFSWLNIIFSKCGQAFG